MTTKTKVDEAIEMIATKLDAFQSTTETLTKRLDERERIEAEADRPGSAVRDAKAAPSFYDPKSGKTIVTLGHEQKLADVSQNKSGVTLGRWLRGIVVGEKADDRRELQDELKSLATSPDASGGYSVPSPLASEFIDNLRANMVLSRAGARTVPMSSKTLQIARVASDPSVSWHIQNASVSASDPTLSAATLTAHTVVGLVKFSLELAQDSINIEQLLSRTLSQATAVAIDAAGLEGTGTVTSPIGNSPTGVLNFSGRNSVTSIGVPTSWDFVANGIRELLVDNVPLERIGALIYSPLLWSKMAKLKTGISSDNTALPLPSYMQDRAQYVTTSVASTGSPVRTSAYIGDWGDLLFGVRQDVTVKVLDQAFMGSNLQLAMLVFARVDFQPARAASFCSLEGITVGAG